ncbi:hypothetical protein IFM89_003411 [Coptis chinensis]|uniref:Uncharacterized protein n=1 Tax=Coptis chinensis TaxID=261450 RepID=A0A835GX27_9MAGN|nr:hypothetical protein IFM89_003411 [Coptis chinensis]
MVHGKSKVLPTYVKPLASKNRIKEPSIVVVATGEEASLMAWISMQQQLFFKDLVSLMMYLLAIEQLMSSTSELRLTGSSHGEGEVIRLSIPVTQRKAVLTQESGVLFVKASLMAWISMQQQLFFQGFGSGIGTLRGSVKSLDAVSSEMVHGKSKSFASTSVKPLASENQIKEPSIVVVATGRRGSNPSIHSSHSTQSSINTGVRGSLREGFFDGMDIDATTTING